MTTQELKKYIDKVLGNSIRCLLPSYWWKKLFGLVVDKIDEVDSKFDDVKITSDTTMSDSSTNPVQNKVIYNELTKKQDTLVSGTNIKTINGNTLLGSGDMEIAEALLPIYIPIANYTLSEEEIAANITAYNEYHSDTNKKLIYAIIRISHNDILGSIPMSILNWYGDTFTTGDWDSGSDYDTFAYTLSSDGSITYEGLRKADASLNTSSTQPVQNKVITAALNLKVDKVEGKQLSTEDFTTLLKTKLDGLSNYDDTEINNSISALETQLNTLVGGDASTAIDNFNEIISFLNGVEDTESLDSIIASIEQQIANKQDAISDLATIRSGASLGATALQEHQDISHLATKTELQTEVDTLNGTITTLQTEVITNEEIYAAAVNDLNSRLTVNESGLTTEIESRESLLGEFNTFKDEVVANEEVWATSLTDINDRIDANYQYGETTYATKTELQTNVETINTVILDNEEVIAATLTDLNAQIAALNATIALLTTRIETLENA